MPSANAHVEEGRLMSLAIESINSTIFHRKKKRKVLSSELAKLLQFATATLSIFYFVVASRWFAVLSSPSESSASISARALFIIVMGMIKKEEPNWMGKKQFLCSTQTTNKNTPKQLYVFERQMWISFECLICLPDCWNVFLGEDTSSIILCKEPPEDCLSESKTIRLRWKDSFGGFPFIPLRLDVMQSCVGWTGSSG